MYLLVMEALEIVAETKRRIGLIVAATRRCRELVLLGTRLRRTISAKVAAPTLVGVVVSVLEGVDWTMRRGCLVGFSVL